MSTVNQDTQRTRELLRALAPELRAEVDELGRVFGEGTVLVAQGRQVLERVDDRIDEDDTASRSALILVLDQSMNYSGRLAEERFSRLWFDKMAGQLDQLRADVPLTARAYSKIKHVSAIFDVLARPASAQIPRADGRADERP